MAIYAMNMQANFFDVSDKSEHQLGDVALGSEDTIWIYGQAAEAVAIGTCTIETATGTFQITDLAGLHTAPVAFTTGQFGWVQQTAEVTPGA